MAMFRRFWVALAFAVSVFGGVPAQADVITGTFGPPGFNWVHPSGNATPNHIWVTGDEWGQTFTGTGLPNATDMALSIFIDDNILTAGNVLSLDVLVNGIDVGDIDIASGITGQQDYIFSFASILGDAFAIEMVAKNTIPGGEGSVSMAADNERSRFFLSSAVPEPATIVLCGIALLGASLTRRRRPG